MEKPTAKILCADETLDLLNCVAGSSFDQDKCARFLDALRACVVEKKVTKFTIKDPSHANEVLNSKEKPQNN